MISVESIIIVVDEEMAFGNKEFMTVVKEMTTIVIKMKNGTDELPIEFEKMQFHKESMEACFCET